MSNSQIELNQKINKLYDSSTLFKKYGLDVWITMIVIIIFLFATGYYHILNHLHSLRKDWIKIRCNPQYMPFAGFINKDSNKTNFESVINNFSQCLTNIIKTDTEVALDPVYYSLNNITGIFKDFSNTFTSFRKMYSYLRTQFQKIYTNIITLIINLCIPLLNIFIKLKDSIAKLIGILTASLFAYLVEYRLMKIYLINIGIVIMLEVFIPTVLSTIISLYASFGLLAVPFVGWGLFAAKLALTVPIIALLIVIFTFLCILIVFTNQVYTDTLQNMPPHPPMI